MADIRLQLARYAQGIHWVQKNFLLDESISAVLVTAGPMPLPSLQQPSVAASSQSSHVVLQMQPDFNTPFPAPESWNRQVGCGKLVCMMLCRVGADLSMHWLLMCMAASTDSDTLTLSLHRDCTVRNLSCFAFPSQQNGTSATVKLASGHTVVQPVCKAGPALSSFSAALSSVISCLKQCCQRH